MVLGLAKVGGTRHGLAQVRTGGSWHAVKSSWCSLRGAQRGKCLECERTLVLAPGESRNGQAFKDQVPAAYQDRTSLRGSKRTITHNLAFQQQATPDWSSLLNYCMARMYMFLQVSLYSKLIDAIGTGTTQSSL